MKWNHLPSPGGLYDQDPQLLEDFQFIFGEIGKKMTEEERKREQDQKRQQAGARTPNRSRYAKM